MKELLKADLMKPEIFIGNSGTAVYAGCGHNPGVTAADWLTANFDLQLFAPEDEGRTEDPTARKLSKAREKGQLPKSTELPIAAMMLFGFIGLYYFLPYVWQQMSQFAVACMRGDFSTELGPTNVNALFLMTLFTFIKTVAPALVVGFLIAFFSNLVQTGFLFTVEPLKPKWNKISFTPKKIWEKIVFSKQTAMNFLKSLIKLTVIAWMAYLEISGNIMNLINLNGREVMPGVIMVLTLAFKLGLKAAIFLAVVAIIDIYFQRYEHREKLKMTKQEVKDEWKQMEGDPQVKQKIKERQRAILQRVMMQAVPEADVVITNPTHYAIALKYEQNRGAPEVVAKGQDYIALRIREIAEENGVPLYENPPLAQALWREVEIGEVIPENHYHAVAEILAWVYQMRGAA